MRKDDNRGRGRPKHGCQDGVAILTANVQMCPNVGAVFQPKDDPGRPIGLEVTCDGRMRITLEKEFPHKFRMACRCSALFQLM